MGQVLQFPRAVAATNSQQPVGSPAAAGLAPVVLAGGTPWTPHALPELSKEEVARIRWLVHEASRLPQDEVIDEDGYPQFSAKDFVELTQLYRQLGAPDVAGLDVEAWRRISLALGCVVVNALEGLLDTPGAVALASWRRTDKDVLRYLEALVKNRGYDGCRAHWPAVMSFHRATYGHLPGHN